MTKKNNSANRLHTILKSAVGKNDKNTASEVWAEVFGINISAKNKKDLEVVGNLRLLHTQLEITKELADKSEYSPELYSFAFSRIEKVLSVQNISAAWNHYKGNLTADTLLSISWLSEVLPEDQYQIDTETIESIKKQIDDLRKTLENEGLPTALKTFIESQLEIIEKSLIKQEILGVKAIRDALYNGYSETSDNQNIINENSTSKELSKLGSIWKKMKRIPGVVISTNDAIDAGTNMVDKAVRTIDFIQNFQL
jgi:hypothetical protein